MRRGEPRGRWSEKTIMLETTGDEQGRMLGGRGWLTGRRLTLELKEEINIQTGRNLREVTKWDAKVLN